jgi:nucleotide-binding universal stress UspA family protein
MKDVAMRILVAIDGSPCSDIAIDQIATRPWTVGSDLEVVTVINPLPVVGAEAWALPPEYYDDVSSAAAEGGDRVLAAARERLAGRADALAPRFEALSGPPARTIIEEAERVRADLVVVGSHGYGAFKRSVLGSVSHAVALHAPCSVEGVREPVHK